jgi:hypothetical protein
MADSSSGKDTAQQLIKLLLSTTNQLKHFVCKDFQSGNGLAHELDAHPALIAVVDEIGLWLSRYGDTKNGAGANGQAGKRNMMTLWSSANRPWDGPCYTDKTRKSIHIVDPHLCVWGAGTGEHVMKFIKGAGMTDGFVPRWMFFVPDDPRPARRKGTRKLVCPPELVTLAQSIARGGMDGNLPPQPMSPDTPFAALVTVPWADVAAEAKHEWWLDDQREPILQDRTLSKDVQAVYGKWGEHSIKLATLRAISRSPGSPAIRTDDVDWGWNLSRYCMGTILDAVADAARTELEADAIEVEKVIRDSGREGIGGKPFYTAVRSIRDQEKILHRLVTAKLIGKVQGRKPARGATPVVWKHREHMTSAELAMG